MLCPPFAEAPARLHLAGLGPTCGRGAVLLVPRDGRSARLPQKARVSTSLPAWGWAAGSGGVLTARGTGRGGAAMVLAQVDLRTWQGRLGVVRGAGLSLALRAG